MIGYGIRFLPLIRELQKAHPCVTNSWYAVDVGAEWIFEHILDHFKDIQERGPPRGCFPDMTKSILVLAQRNLRRSEEFFFDPIPWFFSEK